MTQLILCSPSHVASLSADKPDEAYQDVTAAIADWSRTTQRSFDIPHLFSVVQMSNVLLYKNLGEQAWALIDREWIWIRRLLFQLRSGYLDVIAYELRGKAALSAASGRSGEAQRILLAEAKRCAAKMEQRKIAWTISYATAIRASIEATSGHRTKSLRFLAKAEAELELASNRMGAAAMRYRRGSLIGGKDGRNLQDSATAFMQSQGILKPQCIVEMLAPGKWQ